MGCGCLIEKRLFLPGKPTRGRDDRVIQDVRQLSCKPALRRSRACGFQSDLSLPLMFRFRSM
jgi:hypothetical protein